MNIGITRFRFLPAYAFMLATLLTACTPKNPGIPATVIGPEKMVAILSDVHIAQAAVSVYNVGDTLRYTVGDYMPAIFKNHGTTQQQFDSSLKYYSANPALLDSIYKEVLEELSKKEGEVDVRARSGSPAN